MLDSVSRPVITFRRNGMIEAHGSVVYVADFRDIEAILRDALPTRDDTERT
jgi:hypothetical protein